jgi:small subunit ribosomal protein S17
MEKRNSRRKLIGVVVSDKMQKTITVLVQTSVRHSLYGKRVKYSKKYKAHDEKEVANLGDKVLIQETRPLSATKCFNLVEVLEKAKVAEVVKEVA